MERKTIQNQSRGFLPDHKALHLDDEARVRLALRSARRPDEKKKISPPRLERILKRSRRSVDTKGGAA